MPKSFYEIEPFLDPQSEQIEYKVKQCGTYGPTSVLAGQSYRQTVGYYRTVEEARKEYPQARVLDSPHLTSHPMFQPRMSDVAPSWFDPAAAGEVWSEDDY